MAGDCLDNSMKKNEQLAAYRQDNTGGALTTNNAMKVSDTDNSLKAGVRGPTLLEDFIFREKITHFDHERIPERVVHARGFGAHGVFEVYESMSEYTTAAFLQKPGQKTPVFVRFSTVVGSRGSADTVRDVRGFATKFYTEEGNFDLVGNNIPVFFIQDAIKFPDVVHAIKPEPHNEIPQATAAHDTFWDFVVNTPETAHMVMWLMSDRALPRSYRMMEGFGVNTFRFINAQGKARFVKFHWKPVLGVHSLAIDEAQKLSGKDPDYHRRDLWEAIERGDYPEYEFGVQMIDEEHEFDFDFDILDPTKFWPEELVPVKIIGKLTLNKNVDNFFAETEQVAFCPANIVPGIDFSNDPLLQGRLFSYEDTQISRLGGPNFREIPINRPVVPVHNNQRDGMHRMTINTGRVSYFPNSLAQNDPSPTPPDRGGYARYAEKVDAHIIRARSESFSDHFSQAAMFWNSLSPWEKKHVVEGFHYEAGSVKDPALRQRVVDMFANVSLDLAMQIAEKMGCRPPAPPTAKIIPMAPSPAVSQANQPSSARTRKVAILIENGVCAQSLQAMITALGAAGVVYETVAATQSPVQTKGGAPVTPDKDFTTTSPLFYDGVLAPGGDHIPALISHYAARSFINEQFHHAKTIGATDEGVNLLRATDCAGVLPAASPGAPAVQSGIVTGEGLPDKQAFCTEFISALARHRHWERTGIPAPAPALSGANA